MRRRTLKAFFPAIASLVLLPTAAGAAPHKKTHTKPKARHGVHVTAKVASVATTTPPPRVDAASTPLVLAPPPDRSTPATGLATARTEDHLSPTSHPPTTSDTFLAPQDRDRAASDGEPIRHRVALTLNPLPLVVGRYGANVEVMLASHHAAIASAFVQTYSRALVHALVPQVDTASLPSPLVGGELGYRLYSGSDGPTGFFAGPSFVVMPFAYPHVGNDLRAELVSFETYGAALDVGAQAVVAGGLTIGGGVGIEYLAYNPPASIAPPPGVSVPSYPEPHVLPRVLFAAGWAF